MYELKTRPETASVESFILAVADAQQRDDSRALCGLMEDVTGGPPVLWGPSIIGFGQYHYRYESGHEGDAPIVGFSPRKGRIAIYGVIGGEWASDLLSRLGAHKKGVGCLYLKRLSDIDAAVLRELVACAWAAGREKWG